jgi:hypothetical protein
MEKISLNYNYQIIHIITRKLMFCKKKMLNSIHRILVKHINKEIMS